MPDNEITVHKFSPNAFIKLVCRDALSRGDPVPNQVAYLSGYCEQLGANRQCSPRSGEIAI